MIICIHNLYIIFTDTNERLLLKIIIYNINIYKEININIYIYKVLLNITKI